MMAIAISRREIKVVTLGSHASNYEPAPGATDIEAGVSVKAVGLHGAGSDVLSLVI
jgi:hypothetical protein